MPDGPSIFAASLTSTESLNDILIREARKAEIIDAMFYPLRKLEELYWSM